MKIPPNLTEEIVLETIERIVCMLAPRYTFGYFSMDDIKQEGRQAGIKGMKDYDHRRPLPNFLYVHINNRLKNLRRDKLRRNDPPCRRCHEGNFCRGEKPCVSYSRWQAINTTKTNIMCPLDLNYISDEKEPNTRYESSVADDVALAELLAKIDTELPVALRGTYLLMREGATVPIQKRQLVEDAIKGILKDDFPDEEG